jgi:hypothetical protein
VKARIEEKIVMTKIVDFPKSFPVMRCPNCGKEAIAACSCNVGYVKAGELALEAVKKNPEKSNSAIAEEIGVSHDTVRQARNKTTTSNQNEKIHATASTRQLLGVTTRTGRDGIVRVMPQPRSKASENTNTHPSIGMKIKEKFGDGKWHKLTTIIEYCDSTEDYVRRTLDSMTKHGAKSEKKQVGAHFEYRIWSLDKAISLMEIVGKLTPILDGLEEQARKNQITMSVSTVAALAGKLRKLLNEWAE